MSSSNTWLTEEGMKQADMFLADSDVFIVERAQALKLMLDMVAWNFPKVEELSILDLGCGDGRWSKAFADRFAARSTLCQSRQSPSQRTNHQDCPIICARFRSAAFATLTATTSIGSSACTAERKGKPEFVGK